MTIVEFLLARVTDDEAVVDEWPTGGNWGLYSPGVMWMDATGRPIYAPRERVLAECAAKRAIVGLHEMVPYWGLDRYGRWLPREGEPKFTYCSCLSEDGVIGGQGPCETLRALAAVYADHPDYDESWRV